MSENKTKRCLVTGGAGFIGSHIVEALLNAGHEVAVLDNLSGGRRENIPADIPLHVLDICADLSPLFREFKPEIIFHHAAQVSVSVSVRQPEEDARVNILGSVHLLKAAVEFGVEKVVYASSGAAYGPLERQPLHEDDRPMPVSPYGISKHTVEHYLRAANDEYGLEWAALRYSNVFGPRQDPHGEAGVVAIFSKRLLKGESPTIFDDGEQTRDYIFVEEIARANVAALEANLAGHPDPVFNISTGKSTSVNALFELIQTALKTDIPAVYGPPRLGDVKHSRLDPARALKELGWQSEISLEEGIGIAMDFFKSRHEGGG